MESLNKEEMLQGMCAGGERIFVSVRVRPLNDKEIARNEVIDWEGIDGNTVIYKNINSGPERSMYPSSYTFDRVFGFDCSTRKVYEEGAKAVVLSVVNGINSSVFAYGQTSSGKTYTMTGITEYTMADIFDYIQKHQERDFILKFSAIEIYNECVMDLIVSDGPLRLLDDPERGTVVERLTEETLRDWNHLKELLSICQAQRQIEETCLNESSSRSHQVIRLTVESSINEFSSKDNSSTLAATVNFVDLAGSERASQTLTAGARLKEGSHINRSLLTLGSVIRKLSNKGRNGHIPYRDSKLTRILQSSLGGNARTAIICTMSPARSYVEQSRNTLHFASCAKEVSTNAHVNMLMSDKALVRQLQKELARLEAELKSAEISIRSDAAVLLKEKDHHIEKTIFAYLGTTVKLMYFWSAGQYLLKQLCGDTVQWQILKLLTMGFEIAMSEFNLEREVRELTLQRDLALSRIQELQPNPTIQGGPDPYYPKLLVRQSWGIPTSGSFTFLDDQCIDVVSRTSESSVAHSRSISDENYLLSDFDEDLLPSIASQQLLIESYSDTPPLQLTVTSKSIEIDTDNAPETTAGPSNENLQEFCRDVQCVELDNELEATLPPEENDKRLPVTGDENTGSTNQEPSSQLLRQDREPSTSFPTYPLHSPEELSAQHETDESENVKQDEAKKVDNYSDRFDKELMGKLQDIQMKLSALKFDTDPEILSQKSCDISVGNGVINGLQPPDTKVVTNGRATDNPTSVAETQDSTITNCEKELLVEEKHLSVDNPAKNVKDGSLDPQDDSGNTNWPSNFKKLQKEIIDLWQVCNVPLIYRTYFFLVFKDDPTDAIYMEVERRRLSFMKDEFSWGKETVLDGHTITPGSSMRSLRQERYMLSKLMKKRLSKVDRKCLYIKWGIKLETRKRSLQLTNLLWTEKEDMEKIEDSAELVARLIKLNNQQVRKEMFGLNLLPRPHKRKLYSWNRNTFWKFGKEH
ncbi:hypothetical protein Ancab_003196 [Ancistrocladus abbreviatus]